MITSNEFDILRDFMSFARIASQSDGLTSNAFENTAGSFLSILLGEHGDAYTVLRSISVLSKTLAKLARLVEEGLSSARRQLLPSIYNKGFHTLPFEIIANIFELSSDYLDPFDSLRNLLLVSSYFRNIAVKIPSLWTTLDVERDPNLALQRSGSKGLRVKLSSIDDPTRPERFLFLLEPHIWRWQSFQLLAEEMDHVDDSDSNEGVFLKQLRENYKGKDSLGLEHLEVSYKTDPDLDWDMDSNHGEPSPHAIQGRTAPARSFFSEWNMPALRSISVTDFILIIPLTCRANITRFQLGLGGEINIGGWDLEIISQTLNSLSSLEDLSIQLSNVNTWINGEEARIDLPSLRRLDLNLSYCELDPPRRLFDALSLPNIKELTIQLCDYLQGDITKIIEALFPNTEPRWPCLEVLSCTFEPVDFNSVHDEAHDCIYPLNRMLSRLPPLRHLSIHVENIYPPQRLGLHQFFYEPTDDQRHPPVPPLRTLRLHCCNHFDTRFIIGLKNVVEAPEFERLEIVGCPNINIGRVRKLIPNGKELRYTP